MSSLKSAFALVGVLLSTLSGQPVHAEDTAACFENWSDAAPVVAREQLSAVRDVHEKARRIHHGEIVRITLCQEDQGYTYRVLLRDWSGRMSNLKVDARTPFAASEAAGR